MRVSAVKCLKCHDTIWSRAHYDFHWCSCRTVAIDGGRDYTRILGDSQDMKALIINVPCTEKEAYHDWNMRINKLGIIKPRKSTSKTAKTAKKTRKLAEVTSKT